MTTNSFVRLRLAVEIVRGSRMVTTPFTVAPGLTDHVALDGRPNDRCSSCL
jgi:hypothetical protein